ncbi:MAG: radical SAM protein [Candidatus Aenigmatarchaeota archaeon]
MTENLKISKNKLLFNSIPAIFYKDKYLLFSPFNSQLAVIDRSSIENEENLKKELPDSFIEEPYSCPGSSTDFFDITFVVTGDCNLRCKYCFAKGGEKKDTISKNNIKTVLGKVKNMEINKIPSFNFFGGEPTIKLNIMKFTVNHVKEKFNSPFRFQVTTNGIFSEDVLNFLVENNFNITISSDGPPNIQNFQRPLDNGGNSSDILERNIRGLLNEGISPMIRSTVTNYSVGKMSKIVKYFADLGIDVIQFEPLSISGRVKDISESGIERPSADEFISNYKEALNEANKQDVEVNSTSHMNLLKPSNNFCDGIGGNRMVINYDGSISKCLEIQNCDHPFASDFIIGRIEDGEIKINNSRKRKIENDTILKKSKECSTCFAKYICAGGCPVRNKHRTGKKAKVDEYFCKINKNILSDIIVRMYKKQG